MRARTDDVKTSEASTAWSDGLPSATTRAPHESSGPAAPGAPPLHSMVAPKPNAVRDEGRRRPSKPLLTGDHAVRVAGDGGESSPQESSGAAVESSELSDPDIVADILDKLRSRAQLVVLQQSGVMVPARVSADSSSGIALELLEPWKGMEDCLAAIHARLHDVWFILEGILQRVGPEWSLGGPLRVCCVNRRCNSRIPVREGTGTLTWSTPRRRGVVLSHAPVHDFGIDGVGVEVASEEVLDTRDPFPALFEMDGSRTLCLAEVRHRVRTRNGSHIGIRLHTSYGRQSLVETYLRHRFPRLIERATVDRGAVMELLDRSGYLDLRAETRPPERWFDLPDSSGLSRDICYRGSDGAIIGHISSTRAYSKAWLGHQIATLKQHPEAVACRREIYLHIAAFATLMDGEDTVMYGYFDRSKKWHQLFFRDFVKWVDDPSLAVIAELDRFERVEPGPFRRLRPAHDPTVEVSEPDAEELVLVTALIRGQLPSLVCDTLDIHPERLHSDCLHDAYRASPYQRGRRVLVLRHRGRLVGAALCEVGSRELTLFNIFNMAFFFFVSSDSNAASPDAQLVLLDRVRAIYAERGEHNPLIVAPPNTFAAASEPGTVLAETMGLIAKAGRSLRQYESFIRYRFGNHADAS